MALQNGKVSRKSKVKFLQIVKQLRRVGTIVGKCSFCTSGKVKILCLLPQLAPPVFPGGTFLFDRPSTYLGFPSCPSPCDRDTHHDLLTAHNRNRSVLSVSLDVAIPKEGATGELHGSKAMDDRAS